MTLGLSTGQALVRLRDQLSSLLEQHQRAARRRSSAQVHTHIRFTSPCFYSHFGVVNTSKIRIIFFLTSLEVVLLVDGGMSNFTRHAYN